MSVDQVAARLTVGLRLADIRDLLAVRDTGTCPCEPAAVLLRRHITQIGTEISRLAALRADLLAMLAAMPGPDRPGPRPGTWRPPGPRPGPARHLPPGPHDPIPGGT
jgi:MerR, DNA binding